MDCAAQIQIWNPGSASKTRKDPRSTDTLQTKWTLKLQIQQLHVLLHIDIPQPNKNTSNLLDLLVPQADVLWFEHVLISCLIAKDEIQPVHGLNHCPAWEHKSRASGQQVTWNHFRSEVSAKNHTGLFSSAVSTLPCTTTPQSLISFLHSIWRRLWNAGKKQSNTHYRHFSAEQWFNHHLLLPVWSNISIIYTAAKSEMSLDTLETSVIKHAIPTLRLI